MRLENLGTNFLIAAAFSASQFGFATGFIADDQVMAHLGDEPSIVVDSERQRILPDIFDWRNMNGVDFVAPVGDQGQCGSCVAFAMLTTLESQLNVARNTPYSPFRFSKQYVFSCGGGKCSQGWLLSEAVNYISEMGAPDSACMEYQSGISGKDVPCSLACTDATDRSLRVSGYERITKGITDITKIKSALLNGPVVTSMILFSDFLTYSSGVYRHKEGFNRGSHAVTLVGWDDNKQAWIARNSMGKKWGENGDFYIAYDDKSLIGRYSYQFNIAYDHKYLAIENLINDSTIRGNHHITLHSAFPNTDRIAVYAVRNKTDLFSLDPAFRQVELEVAPRGDRHPAISSTRSSPSVKRSTSDVQSFIDSNRLTDGRYFIYGAAFHADGHSFSQPIAVEIKNSQSFIEH